MKEIAALLKFHNIEKPGKIAQEIISAVAGPSEPTDGGYSNSTDIIQRD